VAGRFLRYNAGRFLRYDAGCFLRYDAGCFLRYRRHPVLRDPRANIFRDGRHWRAGREELADAHFFQFFDILVRHDAAAGKQDVIQAAIFQQFEDPWEDRHVGAGEHRNTDYIDVFLERRFRDHLRGLTKAGVNDFHSGIPQGSGNNLGAAVVTIQTGFSDENSDFFHA